MKEHAFYYTLYGDNSPAVFKRACYRIEQLCTRLVKHELLIDVDGSTIQIYSDGEKEVIVFDDYDVGAVFAESDIDLSGVLVDRRIFFAAGQKLQPTEMETSALTLTKKRKRREALADMEKRLAGRFPSKVIGGQVCFLAENDWIFFVSEFPGEYALVVEYTRSEEGFGHYCFEDGDCFYLDELSGDALFAATLAEIEAD